MNSKYLIAFFFSVAAPVVYSQALDTSARLEQLAVKMEKFVSGQQKIAAGYAELPAALQQVACSAYPVASDREAIESYRRELEELGAGSPTSEQKVQITVLQNVLLGLHAGVDCSHLPPPAQSASSGA